MSGFVPGHFVCYTVFMLEELGNFNTGLLTMDLIVVALGLAAVLGYSYTVGKDHGVLLIQALYMAAFPFFFIPQVIDLLPDFGFEPDIAHIIYLGILFVITVFILMRNAFFESPMVPSQWEIGVFGILFTGLAATIVGSFLPPEMVEGFSPVVQAAFFGDALLAFWVLAPIGFWVLIKGE